MGKRAEQAGRVPKPVLWISGLVLAVAAVMLFWGAWTIGATWDEKTQTRMLTTFFQQGWHATSEAIVNGLPDPNYIWGVYVYGPVGELVSHAVGLLVGAEHWGSDVAYTAVSTQWRHVGIALQAAVGIVAVAAILRIITRSWTWGVLGAAVLASTPLWIGHGMMNIKDLPTAVGYTVATLGIVALSSDRYFSSKRLRFVGLTALFMGSVLAAGTREASGVPIALTAALSAAFVFVLQIRPYGFNAALRAGATRLLHAALAIGAAYLALVAIYPKAFANPFELAWQALVVSARFPFDESVLTAGQWMDQPPPWTYLPLWFAAQLPLLALVGGIGFILLWAWKTFRSLATSQSNDRDLLSMSWPVILQAVMLPVIAIMTRANMYNGTRQFLMVIPAIAVLATLFIWQTSRFASGTRHARPMSTALWVTVSIGVAVPIIGQLQLFPYNYVYVNLPTAIVGIDERWPTDYWRASSEEILRRVPADGPLACSYESFRYDEFKPCEREPMFEPYLDQRGADALPGALAPGQMWLIQENQGITDLPATCTLHDVITRQLFEQTLTIATISACDIPSGWSIPE